MRNEILDLVNKLGLLDKKRLSKEEIRELEQNYPDGNYPTGIIRDLYDSDLIYKETKIDDYSIEEINLLINIRKYEKTRNIEGFIRYINVTCLLILIIIIITFIIVIL